MGQTSSQQTTDNLGDNSVNQTTNLIAVQSQHIETSETSKKNEQNEQNEQNEIVVDDVILKDASSNVVQINEIKERTEWLRVSPDAKINLLNHLLKVEIKKRALDNEKKARNDFLMKNIVNSLKKNNEELSKENHMLRESLEKYKKLYYDLVQESNELNEFCLSETENALTQLQLLNESRI